MLTKTFLLESEVTSLLQDFETHYPVFQYRLDGWCIWPLLRFRIARGLQNVPLDFQTPVNISRTLVLSIVLQEIRQVIQLHQAFYLVKTSASARSEYTNGLYEDIYFDRLLLELDDYVKIESINSSAFYKRGQNALIKSDLSIILLSILARRMAGIRKPQAVGELAKKIGVHIRDAFGADTLQDVVIEQILSEFYWSKHLYKRLLDRIEPKVLFVGDSSDMALIAASKEAGIKVVEFQHGFLDRNYPQHSWTKEACAHKLNMTIPDRLFLYGEYWRDEMAAYGFWTDELRSVGSVRLDRYLGKGKKLQIKNQTCNLVLTTQGTDTERLIAFVSEFLSLAKGNLDLKLYIKLHPFYDTSMELYRETFALYPVEIVLATQLPTTFELLIQANLHLSIFSTCHYEALGLGVPTVVLPLTGYETVRQLYESGHAFLTRTPQELLELVKNWKNLSVPDGVREKYFQSNALTNIQAELRTL